MTDYAYLIPIFPFLAFVANIFFGRRIGTRAGLVSVAASLIACAIALPAAYQVTQGHTVLVQGTWLTFGANPLEFGYLLDPLSAMMLFVVTVVGTLIQIYSIGYMHGDPRYSRFFAYVSLFMAAMLTLAIASNYLLFFMAWEIVGLCSYLLIGFWFEKNSAADAGKKAFLTTRIGDVGFFLGILTLYFATQTLNFTELKHVIHKEDPLLLAAALLIFCGAIGKSAQFPLHVWLPDAMEGPTPVSALIHAATMVAAGVYLVARSFALFIPFGHALSVVVAVGTLTAFMAAFIALTATDIKKVLAYSTISQLGYMIAALGLGGFTAGTFHLMTHAFFKALLFLGAGSVIHGTGVQDIREMGGLLKKMPHTAITFIIASLAIAGVPPLSGFWSKDEILAAAYTSGNAIVYWILVLTAFMTAFYMFRLVFLTFFGKLRNEKVHAHESPTVMTVPLWILALGSILIGLPGSPWAHNWFQNFMTGAHHAQGHVLHLEVMITSIAAGFGGILLAAWMYLGPKNRGEIFANKFRFLYELSVNKFWIDEIYETWIIRPFQGLAQLLFRFDEKVVDGAVNGTGHTTMLISKIKGWFDLYIVDGLVNFVGNLTRFLSAILRRLQTGLVQQYMLIVFIGVLLLVYLEMKP